MSRKLEAIILVGGLGTRLDPLTRVNPKPLLPVNGVPLIRIQLERLREAGVKRVALATAYKPECFTQYLLSNPVEGIEIKYSFEERALGTGGAVREAFEILASSNDGEDEVVILNGDILSEHSLIEQLSDYRNNKAEISLHTINVSNPSRYGVVLKSEGGLVVEFREKEEEPKSNEINAGCYIIKKRLLSEYLKKGENSSIERDFFPEVLRQNIKTIAYLDNSYWVDIGTPESYFKANLNAVNSLREEYRGLLGYSSYIDARAVIGRNVKISNSIVCKEVEIGDNVTLEKCFLERGAKIAEGGNYRESYITQREIIPINFEKDS